MGACFAVLCGTETMVGLGLFASGATATAVLTADRHVKHKIYNEEDEHLSRPVRDAYKRQTPEPVENNNKDRNRNIVEYMNAPEKTEKGKWAHRIETGNKKKAYAPPRRNQPGAAGVEEPGKGGGAGAQVTPAKMGAKHGNNKVSPGGHDYDIHREIRPKDITGMPYQDSNGIENGTYDVQEPTRTSNHHGGGRDRVDEEAPEPIHKREESWIKRLGNSGLANKLSFLRDRTEEARIRRRANLAVNN
jgi:hypothetical protein